MKILVMGGTGHIGPHVVEEAMKQGHEVLIHGRDLDACEKLRNAGFQVLRADNTHIHAIKVAVTKVDVVINCAGLTKHLSPMQEYWAANVDLVQTLIDACLDSGKKLVHVSSTAGYCTYEERLNVTEDQFLKEEEAAFDYAKSKIHAENIINQAIQKGLKATILRPNIVMGSGDTTVLPTLLKMNNNGGVLQFNNGKTLFDPTDIDNLASAILLAATSDTANGKAFNITNNDPQEIQMLINTLFELMEMPLKTKPVSSWMSFILMNAALPALEIVQKLFPTDDAITKFVVSNFNTSVQYSNDEAINKLGYHPKFNTKASVQNFVGWGKTGGSFLFKPGLTTAEIKKEAKTAAVEHLIEVKKQLNR